MLPIAIPKGQAVWTARRMMKNEKKAETNDKRLFYRRPPANAIYTTPPCIFHTQSSRWGPTTGRTVAAQTVLVPKQQLSPTSSSHFTLPSPSSPTRPSTPSPLPTPLSPIQNSNSPLNLSTSIPGPTRSAKSLLPICPNTLLSVSYRFVL